MAGYLAEESCARTFEEPRSYRRKATASWKARPGNHRDAVRSPRGDGARVGVGGRGNSARGSRVSSVRRARPADSSKRHHETEHQAAPRCRNAARRNAAARRRSFDATGRGAPARGQQSCRPKTTRGTARRRAHPEGNDATTRTGTRRSATNAGNVRRQGSNALRRAEGTGENRPGRLVRYEPEDPARARLASNVTEAPRQGGLRQPYPQVRCATRFTAAVSW